MCTSFKCRLWLAHVLGLLFEQRSLRPSHALLIGVRLFQQSRGSRSQKKMQTLSPKMNPSPMVR